MEIQHYSFVIICSLAFSLGFFAFSACIAAEFKRTKVKDVKLDGKLCYLPESSSFGLGIGALICLSMVQIIGTSLFVCRNFWSSRKNKISGEEKCWKRIVAVSLLVLSWINFGFTIILLSAAISMNRGQAYGEGWLDGECYVVKAGVYIGSAVLILTTIIFLFGSILAIGTRHWTKQVEQGNKVHARVEL